MLEALSQAQPAVKTFTEPYYHCFPDDKRTQEHEDLIRETAGYINEAEHLSQR